MAPSSATGTVPTGVATVSAQLAWQDGGGAWHSSTWVDAAPAGQDMYKLSFNTCSPNLRVPHNGPVRISLRAADKAGNAAEFPSAGLYQFDHPDVDADCTVGLRDLLDVNAALAGRLPFQPDYDIDNDGALTPADATLLESRLPGRPPSSGKTPLFPEASRLPGSLTVTFTPLAALGSLAFAQSAAVTGTTAYIADWTSGDLAAASTLSRHDRRPPPSRPPHLRCHRARRPALRRRPR